jgi:hypothetical protein
MSEQEDGDVTVIDVMNTNQRLRQYEGSETESSRSDGRDSFGENEPDPEIIEVVK